MIDLYRCVPLGFRGVRCRLARVCSANAGPATAGFSCRCSPLGSVGMTTQTNADGWPGVCPGCGASWQVLGGMLPLPLRCSCLGAFEWHEAWRCEHCRVVLAQGCQDTGLWAHEYVPYGAVRLTTGPA